MNAKRIALAVTAVAAVAAGLVGTTAVANAAAPVTCDINPAAPDGDAETFTVSVEVHCTGFADVVLRTSVAGSQDNGRTFSVPVATDRVSGQNAVINNDGSLPFSGPVTAHSVVQATVNGAPVATVVSEDVELG